VNLLFWNTGRREPLDELAALVKGLCVDVLILAECPLSAAQIVERLNTGPRATYHLPFNLADRFTFVVALPPERYGPVYDDSGLSIRHVRPPLGSDFLLAALHLPSKLFLLDDDQALLAPRASQEIERAEHKFGHRRTVVIGDFNMNPFESGLVHSEGFHAVMARSIAAKQGRTVRGVDRRYFYNPMWSLLGDCSPGPPGTYYYSSSSPQAFFWNTFDQVLLRPALAAPFMPGDAMVIDSIGSRSLLTSAGTPNASISDHLPLFAIIHVEELDDAHEESLGAVAQPGTNTDTNAGPQGAGGSAHGHD
jgi:hypothetical protein